MRAELRPREAEVLSLIAQGWSNEEIAGRLGVGLETVKTHVVNVLAVLGARNRARAAAIGVRRGWSARTRPFRRPPRATGPAPELEA